MKKRFTEAHIVGFLRGGRREVAGQGPLPQARVLGGQLLPVAKQVRRHERLRRQAAEELETENTRLKKLLAESLLENEVTREVLRKKW
jgi:putative transposase